MAIKTRKKKAKASPVNAPKFLTLRKYKTLAEATRRQRISAARTKVSPTADPAAVVDLSKGFDTAEED